MQLMVSISHYSAYHGHLISLMKISPYKYTQANTAYCPNDSIRIVSTPNVFVNN